MSFEVEILLRIVFFAGLGYAIGRIVRYRKKRRGRK